MLSTHFCEGKRPKQFNTDKLNSDALLETIEVMKEALDAEDVYPVDPNLVLSTDDTVVFVVEGANNKTHDDGAWKLIDTMNGASSVCSDFEARDDKLRIPEGCEFA